MTCGGDEAFTITDKTVESVTAGFSCVSIPERIVSIEDGTETNYAFLPGKDDIERVDFSKATNLVAIGSFAFYNCRKITEIDLSKCSKLETIGVWCFYYCTKMKSVKLPEVSLINTIQSGCFAYSGLTSFIVPNSVTTIQGVSANRGGNDGIFAYCYSLTKVTFQSVSKIESIGNKAFFYTKLETITFPKSLQKLSYDTFRICKSLKSIEVESGNAVYSSKNGVLLTNGGTRVFYYPNKAVDGDTIQIPEGVTSIGRCAFIGDEYKYINLTGITEICEYAFDRNAYIVNVTIPSTVSVLNKYVFSQCSSLTNVTFEGSYETLEGGFFQQCTSLTIFHIPSGIKTIGDYSFNGCSKLEKIYIPKTVTMIGTGSFSSCAPNLELIFEEGSPISYTANGYLYNSDKTKLIIYLGSSTEATIIPSVKTICNGAFKGKPITSITFEANENIKSIEKEAFRECKSLESIEIPPNINIISEGTFRSCTSLKSVSIPSKVTKIDHYAFRNCTQLSSISFTSEVTKVGVEAFYGCTKLSSITLPDSVKTISESAFSYSGILTFRVPQSLETIANYAFKGSSLKMIEFPDFSNYTSIDRLSFSCAADLETIVFPEYVKYIDESAFASCTSLVNVTIGSSISVISDKSFFDCTSLEKIIIGDNIVLSSLSSKVFDGCTSLKEFDVNERENHFYFDNGMLFNKEQTEIIIFLRATMERYIIIPEKVTKVSSYAFSESNSIERVTFNGKGIQHISPYAFYMCAYLRVINFPSSLQSIGISAFYGCGIKSLHLGEALNITTLSESVFANNKKLKQVVLPTTIEQISSTAFEHVNTKATVIYLGSNKITNKVGFSSSAKVIVTDLYEDDYFVGIHVTRDISRMCSIKPKSIISSTTLNLMTFVFLMK